MCAHITHTLINCLCYLNMFCLFIFSFENLIVLTSEVGETSVLGSYTYCNGLHNLHCMLLKHSLSW